MSTSYNYHQHMHRENLVFLSEAHFYLLKKVNFVLCTVRENLCQSDRGKQL